MPVKLMDYRDLPGGPRLKQVQDVKRELRFHGVSPVNEIWKATWSWADEIACNQSKWSRSKRWPGPRQIAAQYMLLLLCEMRRLSMLRLPLGAENHISEQAADLLSVAGQGKLFVTSEYQGDYSKSIEAAKRPLIETSG